MNSILQQLLNNNQELSKMLIRQREVLTFLQPKFTLKNIRGVLGLKNFTLPNLIKIFRKHQRLTLDDNWLLREEYEKGFLEILGNTINNLTIRLFIDRLWDIFDPSDQGSVSIRELYSGLGVLSGGGRDEKVETILPLWIQKDRLSIEDLTNYLVCVYRVLYLAESGVESKMGVTAEELSLVTSEEVFIDADLDSNCTISIGQFKEWYNESNIFLSS